MRFILTGFLGLAGTAAQAHPGHLADLAGHDHWVASAAIGIAILTGLYGALTGNPKATEETDDDAEVAEDEVPA